MAARKTVFRLMPALFLAGLLAACSEPEPQASIRPIPYDAVIVAFGDSLTAGNGVGKSSAYPAVLQRLLGRKVINAGVPGETTIQGLARLPSVLDKYKPQLLILCHGGNDILRRMSEKQMAANLGKMIRIARSRNIDIILVGVPEKSLMFRMNEVYHQLARHHALPLEKESLVTIMSNRDMRSDHVHPNEKGYRLIAESIYGLLKKFNAL